MQMKKILALLLAFLMLIPTAMVSAETTVTSGTTVTAEQAGQTWGISIHGRSNQIPGTVVTVSVLYPGVDFADVGVSGALAEQNAYTKQILVNDSAEGDNFSVSFPLKAADKGGVYKAYIYIPGEPKPILVNVPCSNQTRRNSLLDSAETLPTAAELVPVFDTSIGDLNAAAGDEYANYSTAKKIYLAQYVIDNRPNWKDTPAAKTDEEKLEDLSAAVGKVTDALAGIKTMSSATRSEIQGFLDADVAAMAAGGDGLLMLPTATVTAYGALTSSQKEEAIVEIEKVAYSLVYPEDVDRVLLSAIAIATEEDEEPGTSNPESNRTPSNKDVSFSAGGDVWSGFDNDETLLPTNEFSDLDATPWATNAVNILASRGVVSSRGDGKFYPADRVSRAEFVKMLVTAFELRLTTEGVLPFEDVNFGDWYYEPISIVYQKDIAKGVSGTAFDPNAPVTRQDMAVLLYKAMSVVNLFISDEGEAQSFTDEAHIVSYAAEPVKNLSRGGVITGRDDGNFDPQATANRAEAATIIYRVMYQFNLL